MRLVLVQDLKPEVETNVGFSRRCRFCERQRATNKHHGCRLLFYTYKCKLVHHQPGADSELRVEWQVWQNN